MKKNSYWLWIAIILSILVLSFIYTFLYSWKVVLLLSMFSFLMFYIMFKSIYYWVKKRKKQLGIWGTITAINGLVSSNSFILAGFKESPYIKVDVPPILTWIALLSFMLLFVLAWWGGKIELNEK